MKKLALGILAGWAIRGAYELVWIHKSSYREVVVFKAGVADEVKKIQQFKDATGELFEAVF